MTEASGTQDTLAESWVEPRKRSSGRGELDLHVGATVGRYVVLSRVGAGGMGVVYAVYDPGLDRKIALKLLHADYPGRDATDGDRRLLFEAKAMAKLSHPNVITVHDVGEHDGRIYVAMEFVDGATLAEWGRQSRRSWREVLDVFVAAGRGLSAAHQAGLVHRDFKPDNIMVGADGRVRVMDFGLAHSNEAVLDQRSPSARSSAPGSPHTQEGSIVGTPAYMAPEQHLGVTVGAAADQFSFCVALWELLFGLRPFAGNGLAELTLHVTTGDRRPAPSGSRVPAWLRKVCDRGLATRPEDRFESMDVMLLALQRGQSRARVRSVAIGLGAVAVLGAGTFAVHSWKRAQAIEDCRAEGASIESTWNPTRAEALQQALLGQGSKLAETTAEKVKPWLDAQATAWADARTQACLNVDVEKTWDADMRSRAEWCLDERRMELDALVTELSSAQDRAALRAVQAAATLGPVDPCLHVELLSRLPAPPTENRDAVQAARAELFRSAALESIGAYEQGLAVARETRARADELGWPPLVAAADLRIGGLLDRTGDYEQAEKVLEDAFFGASKSSATETAFAALASLVFTVGVNRERPADAMRWSRYLEVIAATLPDPAGLRTAARLGSLANVKQRLGEHEEARALLEQALELRVHALGEENPEVARSLANLAEAHWRAGEPEKARALLEQALAIQEEALGPAHPDVALTLNNLANVAQVMGAHREAQTMMERTLAIQEAVLGPEHPHVALSLSNLAALFERTRDHAKARAAIERALAIREKALGPDHPDVGRSLLILANVHRDTGAYDEARALYERSVANLERALGPDHLDVATALEEQAAVYDALGEPAKAAALRERVAAIRAPARPGP